MPILLRIDAKELDELYKRFANADEIWRKAVEPNLRQLGHAIGTYMRRELAPVKYTGALERSISADIDVQSKRFEMEVGPTASHAAYIRWGTRPHWAPIAPLKRWAAWKLGDANAAYAVQRSIAQKGTSEFARRRYGEKTNAYTTRTMLRGDTARSLTTFMDRVTREISKELTK